MSNSITVAVGSPDDIRSSIWRLWVQGDEVYFGERSSVGRFLKVSLHKSGNWHIAWHKDAKPVGEDRFVCRWVRPEPFLGLVSGIFVLVDPFRPREPFKNKALLDPAIQWLPLPPFDNALVLKVMIATNHADLDQSHFFPTEKIITCLDKLNGEQATLVSQNLPLTNPVRQTIFDVRSECTGFGIPERTIDTNPIFDRTRVLLIKQPKYPHVCPWIYDVALGWEHVEVK